MHSGCDCRAPSACSRVRLQHLTEYSHASVTCRGRVQQQVITPNDFLRASKLDHINLPELLFHQHEHHLVFKVAGYADEVAAAAASAAQQQPATLTAAVNRHAKASTVWPDTFATRLHL
jgi:hypothetical protein